MLPKLHRFLTLNRGFQVEIRMFNLEFRMVGFLEIIGGINLKLGVTFHFQILTRTLRKL